MINDKTREEFETWAANKGMAMHLARSESGLYVSRVTQNYMDCWMASRASVVVDLPIKTNARPAEEVSWHSIRNQTIDACARSIQAAGLQVKP